MSALTSAPAEGGGWRRSPVVAAIALLGIAFAVYNFTCRSRTGTAVEDLPEVAQRDAMEIPRYCSVCKAVFLLARTELEKIPGDAPLIVKARTAKCPTCGDTNSVDVIRCLQCNECFSPVEPESKGGTVCPKCGKNPFGG